MASGVSCLSWAGLLDYLFGPNVIKGSLQAEEGGSSESKGRVMMEEGRRAVTSLAWQPEARQRAKERCLKANESRARMLASHIQKENSPVAAVI